MENALKNGANRQSKLEYLLAIFSVFGILDAGYLTYKYFAGGSIKCGLLNGCDTVTTSAYSAIAGVPVSLLGLGFYLAVFFLALIMIETASRRFAGLLFFLSLGALAFSAYLVYVQAAILRSYCLYCLISALTVFAIFITSIFLIRGRDSGVKS